MINSEGDMGFRLSTTQALEAVCGLQVHPFLTRKGPAITSLSCSTSVLNCAIQSAMCAAVAGICLSNYIGALFVALAAAFLIHLMIGVVTRCGVLSIHRHSTNGIMVAVTRGATFGTCAGIGLPVYVNAIQCTRRTVRRASILGSDFTIKIGQWLSFAATSAGLVGYNIHAIRSFQRVVMLRAVSAAPGRSCASNYSTFSALGG
jgi:hypothetical protein